MSIYINQIEQLVVQHLFHTQADKAQNIATQTLLYIHFFLFKAKQKGLQTFTHDGELFTALALGK